MTNEKPDLLVFIGRFQPFHNSHYEIVRRALNQAPRVLVLVGSSNNTRSPKNPFTFSEREVMVRAAFPAVSPDRLIVKPIRDFPYSEDQWLAEVQTAVENVARSLEKPKATVRIIGHSKDDSSYYLEMFPQWAPVIEQPNFEGRSATELRDIFLDSRGPGSDLVLQSAVPAPVFAFMQDFRRLPQYETLKKEYGFLQKYQAQFANAPYPPIFTTVDAVVIHSGHLLVVERKAEPGRGLLALPGGFLDSKERLLDSVIRELREETRLKIPEPVLRGSIKNSAVFDNPGRSQRGRTITHAYHFEFTAGKLPMVKGGDDAAHARWMPLSEFYELDGRMFEDHWHIVISFIGRRPSTS